MSPYRAAPLVEPTRETWWQAQVREAAFAIERGASRLRLRAEGHAASLEAMDRAAKALRGRVPRCFCCNAPVERWRVNVDEARESVRMIARVHGTTHERTLARSAIAAVKDNVFALHDLLWRGQEA